MIQFNNEIPKDELSQCPGCDENCAIESGSYSNNVCNFCDNVGYLGEEEEDDDSIFGDDSISDDESKYDFDREEDIDYINSTLDRVEEYEGADPDEYFNREEDAFYTLENPSKIK